MTTDSTEFAQLVTGFLTDYLPLQRNFSKNTVKSYRDTFKLLIRFITEEKEKNLMKFDMGDFDKKLIVDFIEWLRKRGSKASSMNQRLAAIKSFTEYAGVEKVEFLAPLQSIQCIDSKKSRSPEITFLSVEEIKQLINRPDISTTNGLRHRVVLTLLYDSGCRVQELCDLRKADIYTGNNPTLRLHGKGNKFRTVAISEETSKLVEGYMMRLRRNALADSPLIINRVGAEITRDGVNHIIRKYAQEIRKENPDFPNNVHAHSFRHSKAMHMLVAGINIVYIRDFLGHEDVSTTMIYAKADNRLKNEAINKLAPKITNGEDFPDWRNDKDLMGFLNSL